MNLFIVIGALLLVGVLAGYIILTRREIASLPPLERKSPDKKTKVDS